MRTIQHLRGVLPLLVAILLSATVVASAQTETHHRLITITELKATPQGKGWVIEVSGKAPDVPDGTKVEFQLKWQGQTIETFDVVIQGGRFSEALEPKRTLISPIPFTFRTEIHRDKQSSAVRKKLEQQPDHFSPSQESYVDYHFDHEFHLSTPEEVAEELKDIRKFFVDHYTALAQIDGAVRAKAKAVREGTEWVRNDVFDADDWRKWFEKDVVDELRKHQKEIGESYEKKRFTAYRRTLFVLEEIAHGVARRALESQKDLFQEKGVDLEKDDEEFEDLSTETRQRRVTDVYLNQLIQQIQTDLGMNRPATPPGEGTGEGEGEGEDGVEPAGGDRGEGGSQ